MSESRILDTRQELITALENANIAASFSVTVPSALFPPIVVIVPAEPYLEIQTVGKSALRARINFILTCAVAYNDNKSAVDNLEALLVGTMQAIPSGYEVMGASAPSVVTVGDSQLLASDIQCSTYYTQT